MDSCRLTNRLCRSKEETIAEISLQNDTYDFFKYNKGRTLVIPLHLSSRYALYYVVVTVSRTWLTKLA